MRKPGLLLFLLSAVALPAAAQDDVLLEKLTNGQDADSPPGPILLVGASVTWFLQMVQAASLLAPWSVHPRDSLRDDAARASSL